jgi:hypothetical protein
MDLIYDVHAVKHTYKIINPREFRVSGLNNSISPRLVITSQMMYLPIGTIVEIDQMYINHSNPFMVKCFVPSFDAFIDAISLNELEFIKPTIS